MSKTKAERKKPKLIPYSELTNKVAAVWTRVSSEEQEKTNCSLDTQRSACEEYAHKHGIRIKTYFGGTWESAKTEGNKHKQMVREVIRDKEINVILVRTFDRFGRAGAETQVRQILQNALLFVPQPGYCRTIPSAVFPDNGHIPDTAC